MISSLPLAPQFPRSAQVVIVGGGAVGLCMAAHLARSGQKVLLLEAGDEDASGAPQDLFAEATSQGRRFAGLEAGRLRGLGGTTNLWGGQLVKFDSIVFQERDWLADSGWPISRDDLETYYEDAFDLLGLARRLDDACVWQRLGIDPPQCGPELDLYQARWTPEPNLARFFAEDLREHANLTVLTNATATALRLDPDNGRIVGLSIAGHDGRRQEIDAGAIILAAGTFEIARLLMMPLADGRPAPWSDNPWLGRGFVDHVDAYAGDVELLDKKRFHRLFDAAVLDGLKYLPRLKLSETAQHQERLLGVSGHFVFASEHHEYLKAFKTFARAALQGKVDRSASGHLIRGLKAALPATAHYVLSQRVYNPGDLGIKFRMSAEQIALAESSVRLTDRRDALGMPVLALDWRIDGQELATLSTFARHVDSFLRREGLASIDIDPLLAENDARFLEKIDDGYHHMGTTRMGSSPSDGVVDADLKVHGTENLFVAGAATFRSTGFANPTLTAIALGLRLAERLSR